MLTAPIYNLAPVNGKQEVTFSLCGPRPKVLHEPPAESLPLAHGFCFGIFLGGGVGGEEKGKGGLEDF